jgi:simple sugar transport system ATP-binding protein
MTTLQVSNISKSFESNLVINQISLSFQSGQVTSLLGDNGAGKSTLLKIISGIVNPSFGSIFLNEIDISNLSVKLRRESGIETVYQDYALFKHHSGLMNLFAQREYLMTFKKLDHKRMKLEAQKLFTDLDLDFSLLEKTPAELSGGQQQSIALARAELFNPTVILLDEPTAALGAKEVKRTLDLIRKWKSQNKIIILISHRFQDVFEVSDRIIILKNGSVFSDRLVSDTSVERVVSEIVN